MSTVTAHLDGLGVPYEVITHEVALSSIEEAKALGVDADEVLKTVVFTTEHGYAIAVLPASRRVDIDSIRAATGDRQSRLATEGQLRHEYPDIELGAFPPIGSILQAITFVDPEVFQHSTVVFAGGTTTESIRMRTDDVFRSEMVRLLPLEERASV